MKELLLLSNEYIHYVLVGGFVVIGIIFYLMGIGKIIWYILSDHIKSKSKSKTISKENLLVENNHIPKDSSHVNDNFTLNQKNSKSKAQHLYDSILNELSGLTVAEKDQYVGEILKTMDDEEFEKIIKRTISKMRKYISKNQYEKNKKKILDNTGN